MGLRTCWNSKAERSSRSRWDSRARGGGGGVGAQAGIGGGGWWEGAGRDSLASLAPPPHTTPCTLPLFPAPEARSYVDNSRCPGGDDPSPLSSRHGARQRDGAWHAPRICPLPRLTAHTHPLPRLNPHASPLPRLTTPRPLPLPPPPLHNPLTLSPPPSRSRPSSLPSSPPPPRSPSSPWTSPSTR